MSTPFVEEVERQAFEHDGFVVRRKVFGDAELDALVDHFASLSEALRASEADGGEARSPEEQWPRLLQTHEHDPDTRRLLADGRLMGFIGGVLGVAIGGFQTMWYWKPPGARGQALHQDEYYVRSVGGTCAAAWLAVDATDDANGCLWVVPGSHGTDVQCPHTADPAVSTSRHEVDVPEGMHAAPVEMDRGDVLFFDGRLIHGSKPNRTADRWRRTFVAHYLPLTTSACADGYNRLIEASGVTIDIDASGPDSDPCGGPAF